MASIEKITESKAFPILLIGGGVVAVLALLSSSNSVKKEVQTVYASYPDSDRNADVIISSLQNSLSDLEESITDKMSQQFVATNDYISYGLDAQQALADRNLETIENGFEYMMEGLDLAMTSVLDNSDSNTESLSDLINASEHSVSSQLDNIMNNQDNILTGIDSLADQTTAHFDRMYDQNDNNTTAIMENQVNLFDSQNSKFTALQDSLNLTNKNIEVNNGKMLSAIDATNKNIQNFADTTNANYLDMTSQKAPIIDAQFQHVDKERQIK